MAIVTISRGSASRGLMLAEGLAAKLGYEIVSREDIVHEAASFGVPEERLQEALVKAPGFWGRFSHDRRRYVAFVQAALAAHAQRDRIIYHGNAGHLLLRDISHVVCIRLIAPLAFRVRMLTERQKMTPEEAAQTISKVDEQRRNWTRFLYGEDWLDPHLYDLVINLKTLDVDGAVEVAARAIESPQFAPTEESRQAMADLVLASGVRAALAANVETASAEIQVVARDGNVKLRGRVRPASMLDAVIEVTGSVEGVRQVNHEDLDAPELTV